MQIFLGKSELIVLAAEVVDGELKVGLFLVKEKI